jgi:phosphate ABC transporter phosphate-binding protein
MGRNPGTPAVIVCFTVKKVGNFQVLEELPLFSLRITMENIPRYTFLGLLVVVIGLLVGIKMHSENMKRPEPPIQGAGSTFVNPLMVHWSAHHEKTPSGCQVGYQSVGSGTGVRFLLEKRIDFACSEAPLSDDQLTQIRKNGGDAIHIPLVLGAVVPAYQLPQIKVPLRFSGPILADIYLGKIKKWNDKALRECNPGIEMPDQEIIVVHRVDSSGTTDVWTDYLSKVSPEWKEKVNVGTDVKWPVGIGETGNEGVAEKVHKTPGSIGYVELTYAYRLDLAHGLVQNREKEYVKGSLKSITAAAANALGSIPDDLRYSLTDAPGKESFPIVGTTWAIVQSRQPFPKGQHLVDFLKWADGEGQDLVQDLLYARLPEDLALRARLKIDEIKVGE